MVCREIPLAPCIPELDKILRRSGIAEALSILILLVPKIRFYHIRPYACGLCLLDTMFLYRLGNKQFTYYLQDWQRPQAGP